jgi:hypothetical protein
MPGKGVGKLQRYGLSASAITTIVAIVNIAAAIKVAGISHIKCATRFKYNAAIAAQCTANTIGLILNCTVISHQILTHHTSALGKQGTHVIKRIGFAHVMCRAVIIIVLFIALGFGNDAASSDTNNARADCQHLSVLSFFWFESVAGF